MPFNWTPESERTMLLIACSELKPKPDTWALVAEKLGGSLNANAVSQKFYKLKRESDKLLAETGNGSAPQTPSTKPRAKDSTPSSTKSRNRKGRDTDLGETPAAKRMKSGLLPDMQTYSTGLDDGYDIEVKDEEEEEKDAEDAVESKPTHFRTPVRKVERVHLDHVDDEDVA